MVYLLIAILALAAILLLIRLRLRVEFSEERKLLFVGLGNSGSEFDFRKRQGELRLFGVRIKRFAFGKGKRLKAAREAISKAVGSKEAEEPTRLSADKRTKFQTWRPILPQCIKASGRYLLALLKATIVEQAEGEIEAGFESPAYTGQAFGYYQAALAAAPTLLGRVQYIPDWSGKSFSGTVRCTVAWPVYSVVWQTTLLLLRLPVMKIFKLAIRNK